jgi:hypothetical protein
LELMKHVYQPNYGRVQDTIAYAEIFYCKTYLCHEKTIMCYQIRDRFIGNMEVNINFNVEKSIKSNTKFY